MQGMSAQKEGPDAPEIALSLLFHPLPPRPTLATLLHVSHVSQPQTTPKNLLEILRAVAWFSHLWRAWGGFHLPRPS